MLTYDIQSQRLSGTVGNQRFDMVAVSGGGRGSKIRPEGQETLRSWSVGTKEDATRGDRGGPIPPGFYICRHLQNHPPFGECIFLEQTLTSLLVLTPGSPLGVEVQQRDGFYVHGRGPKGSDGCIVPLVETERQRLNHAVAANPGTPLRVVNPYLPDDLGRADTAYG